MANRQALVATMKAFSAFIVGFVRLKACLIGEVEVLFRHTLSGL
jgi:hypothetical protein